MLQVLEHILMMPLAQQSINNSYLDAVKDLQMDGGYELQRLARQMPDHLLVRAPGGIYASIWLMIIFKNVYDQLESKVNELAQSGVVDVRRQVSYRAFLMTIM